MRIALDAMGGDYAPQAPVEGAYLYQKETAARNELVLIGSQERIEQEFAQHHAWQDLNIKIVHTAEEISMNESPTEVLKTKKNASMLVGIDQHKRAGRGAD